MKNEKCKLKIADRVTRVLLGVTLGLLLCGLSSGAVASETLKVCATIPDLGFLAREIGGEEADVIVFAKGTEDAHFIEARPSFIKELSQADVYIQNGLDLEIGWAPVLLKGSRNSKVQPGSPGYIDASHVIQPLQVPAGRVDRTLGDVHPYGNPHYLLDPMNGLKVAGLIRDRLSDLRPEKRADFDQRYQAFHERRAEALVGRKLAADYEYDIEGLMRLFDADRLMPFLQQQGHIQDLGGWLGRMRPHFGTLAVDDPDMWVYFAHRFKLQIIEDMEPKPGLMPTTRHLSTLVNTMKQRDVKLVITGPYFPPRHAAFLAKNTGARNAVLAHQSQAVPRATGYMAMIEYNISSLIDALEGGGG